MADVLNIAMADVLNLAMVDVLNPANHKTIVTVNCLICDETFNSKQQLSKHKRRIHSDVPVELGGPSTKNVICLFCSKRFASGFSLRRHIRLIHNPTVMSPGLKTKNARCYTCSKCFFRRATLRRHIQKAHPELDVKIACPLKPKLVASCPGMYITYNIGLKTHEDIVSNWSVNNFSFSYSISIRQR